ncbi:PREDICTED: O-acyltransferase WSD1-like [Lupinus angustifolius]|nr:PREDICTED: O-acyltransferase WSD1-like [Lupinus angustifolius]
MEMDKLYEEEVEVPVSPPGQYFNSSVICSYVFGFLEVGVPIDHSKALTLIQDVFLPINPRFSSIMVRDEDGKMRWKRVEVKPEEHLKIPTFPDSTSSDQLYDHYFDEYVSSILTERTPQTKPLWEIHIIKYPTTNAIGTIIFKLHHALGDGYSLMGALLSCLQRADDPSFPLSFPSRVPSNSQHANKNLLKKLPSFISTFFSSMSDFGWSLMKSKIIKDDKTPIRSGYEGTESQPFTLSNISLSLDQIKKIKSKLGVTINDLVTGMVFYGLRLYMQEMNDKAKISNSTAIVMLNTRNLGGYQSVKDMLKPEAEGLWGNKISFLQVSIPKLNQTRMSNPLEFVWKAHEIIKKKRRSFSVYLIGLLLQLEMKLRGPEAVAKNIYNTMGNSSVVLSNLVGPIEHMTLAKHPISGFYFTMTGGPENVNITIISYVKVLRITLRTLKGFIDEQKLKLCMEKAFEIIFKASMEIPDKN